MYQKYTGIILKRHPFGEADELLTIYTREFGKIRAKAVSVRKPLSKLSGHLQSLNEIEFETAGTKIPILISVRALSVNTYLRQNLRKFGYALVGIETLYRLTGDQQGNAEAYDELRAFLKNLGETRDENLALRKFQLNLLAVSGYAFPTNTQTDPDSTPVGAPLGSLRGAGLTNTDELKLTAQIEQDIDRFIDYVLEREISKIFFPLCYFSWSERRTFGSSPLLY